MQSVVVSTTVLSKSTTNPPVAPTVFHEMPSLFIVGPMGAGKTTVGKLLARYFSRSFIDSDQYIERQTGADIAWIFAKEGEAGFRERESRAIDTLTNLPNVVMATGGGAILSRENRTHLKQRGITIYLQASVDMQMIRTAKDKNRPLLQTKNPRKVLQDLSDVRNPLYLEVADVVVSTANVYPKKMLAHVVNALAEQYPQWVTPYEVRRPNTP